MVFIDMDQLFYMIHLLVKVALYVYCTVVECRKMLDVASDSFE